MDARKRFGRKGAPAAKLLLAACGLAGCTGGPSVSSAAEETPSALVRSEERALAAGESAGRMHVADRRVAAARPVWATTARRQDATAANPFAVRRSPTGVATAARSTRSTVRRVAHAEPTAGTYGAAAAIAKPRTAASASTGGPAGVARIQDHRLPPAAPLGSANPFAHAGGAIEERHVEAAPVAHRATAKPASLAPAAPRERIAARRAESQVPIPTFLTPRTSGDGAVSGPVRNEDMIVDSADLPKRGAWRTDILPTPEELPTGDYPITPRRSFTSSATGGNAAASTANLPIEISPSGRFQTNVIPFTPTFSTKEEADPSTPIASIDPGPSASADPFATFEAAKAAPAPPVMESPLLTETDSPLAETSIATGEEWEPEITAAPLLAPGPPLDVPDMNAAAVGAPMIASAVPEKAPTRLSEYSGTSRVSPIELTEADRLAKKAAQGNQMVSPPVAVGLALALVAIGAVLIRRRLG